MNHISKVSVVMPTYNGSKYIKRAIESILGQTYTNFEFLIIDDGSEDNTAEIIHSFNDKRIKYIYQDNRGPASAYNTGFKNATTDFIFVMDHDDISYPIRLEKQLEYLVKNNLDVCGSFYLIKNEERGFIEKKRLPINDQNIKRELLYRPWTLFNPTLCIQKSIFDEYGFYDEQIKVGYDYDYFLRISEYAICGNIPEYLYEWTLHKKSYGSTHKNHGNEIFQRISINKLDSGKLSWPQNEKLFYKGMVYYYSNSFFKSAGCFLKSIASGYLRYKVFLYLILVTVLSPLVIFLRKNNLFSHPFLARLKRIGHDFH